MDVIKRKIILDRLYPEYLVALPPEPVMRLISDKEVPEVPKIVMLVYRPDRRISDYGEWLYVYSGCRIS